MNKRFDKYMDENPRSCIADQEMEKFVKYATQRYGEHEHVNNTHHNGEIEEIEDEVKSYIGDCMEALILFREFKEGHI